MNISKKLRNAVILAVATAGLATSPAMAMQGVGTISNGPVKPTVKWDQNAWKQCYTVTYAQWRDGGASPSTSQSAADLTCGKQP